MDLLSTAISPMDVRNQIEELERSDQRKDGLSNVSICDKYYDSIMLRIGRQPKSESKLAMNTLNWVLFAARPLTVDELREAVSIELVDWTNKSPRDLNPLDLPDEGLLTALCGGLVTVDPNTRLVRLVHKTLQEYLLRKSYHYLLGQADLADICLSYVMFDVFAEGACENKTSFQARHQKYKLYAYAAEYWGRRPQGTRRSCSGTRRRIRCCRLSRAIRVGSIWSPGGKLLASGSEDGMVKLWDAAAGSVLHRLLLLDLVCSIAFSPDGKLLASGSEDRTVRLW